MPTPLRDEYLSSIARGLKRMQVNPDTTFEDVVNGIGANDAGNLLLWGGFNGYEEGQADEKIESLPDFEKHPLNYVTGNPTINLARIAEATGIALV